MCILIEISIKIYFINLAAGNGPKIHNARVNTHTAHTHPRRRCTRTLVNAHTRRLHTHARERTHATAAHAQDMLPRTHTRRQGNARLRTRTRDNHARTRHVDAQARSWENAHGTHEHERFMQRTLVNTHTHTHTHTHIHDDHVRMLSCTHAHVHTG